MNNQQLSVLLETISFFFVAIDLYGRERLQKTNDKLLSVTETMFASIGRIQNFDWTKSKSKRLMRIIYIVNGIITLPFLITAVRWALIENGYASALFTFLIMSTLGYGFVLLFVLLGIIILSIVVLTTAWLLQHLFGGLHKLLRITDFEGLLLIIGSILFIISKYLQIY